MIYLYLNGKNVTAEYGIYLTEKSLTALMTPAPMKSYLENKPTLGDGKEILLNEVNINRDERDVTLTIGIKAANQAAMLTSFTKLTEILYAGKVVLKTSFDNSKNYNLYYQSCSQLQTFFRGIALFTIKFVEPDPTDNTAYNG